ncbi:hypothetical protein D3C74_443720 [compost metagenome]
MPLRGADIKADNRVQTECQGTVAYRLSGIEQVMQHAFPQAFSADYGLAGADIPVHRVKYNQPGDDDIPPALGEPVQIFAFLIRNGRQRLHKFIYSLTEKSVAV